MPDALDAVQNEEFRRQLSKLRDTVGAYIQAERLRESLPGFKGQKGIYKPAGSIHALWVRQTLRGVYPDQEPAILPDGSWTYRYAPEGREGKPDMALDTNRSLLRCSQDHVPIGVLVQREDDRYGRAYENLGLAFVEGFDGTHFLLRGEPIDWEVQPMQLAVPPAFNPYETGPRAQNLVSRELRDRRFKFAVRKLYHEKCSLCQLGYRFHGRPLGLEAAHIVPFEDNGTSSDIRNGVLLCRNHHSLFDGWAWTFDEDYRVRISPDKEFRDSAVPNHVLKLEGARLPNLPDSEEDYPAVEAIRIRLERFEASSA